MTTIRLPRNFSEFLRLLNSNGAKYLLIGGYAVNYYGYSRSTGDMDVWVERSAENAEHVASALRQFGFAGVQAETILVPDQILRS